MRIASFLLAAMLLIAPAAGSAQRAGPRDWSAQAVATPTGYYVLGNPAARVKLVEYASYTCSHCADFSVSAKPILSQRIRAGTTSFELRHLIRDAFDLAAVTVARCGGPTRFARISDAIFAGQSVWLPRGSAFARTNAETLRQSAPLVQLRALADGAGLSAIGRAQGLTDADLARCFADSAAIDRVVQAGRDLPPEVKGTPAFFVNGRFAAVGTWAALQPLLAAR